MAALKETAIADVIDNFVISETVLTPLVPFNHAPKNMKMEARMVAILYFITPETTGGPKTVDMLLKPKVQPKKMIGTDIAKIISFYTSILN